MAVDSLGPITLSPMLLNNDWGMPLYNFPMYTPPMLEYHSDDTLAASSVEDHGYTSSSTSFKVFYPLWQPIVMTPPALTASLGQVLLSKIDDYLSLDAAAAMAILWEDCLHNCTGFCSSFCDPKALSISLRALELGYPVPVGLVDTIHCTEYASTLLSLSTDHVTNDMDLDVPLDVTPPAPLVLCLKLDTNHLVIMDGDTPVSLVAPYQLVTSWRILTSFWISIFLFYSSHYAFSGRRHRSSSYTPGNGYYGLGRESGYDADNET
ncbi:hypothetical protein H0H81_003292 [Sphagnurus paluster]|uniref:Uncharacterized protein n=1 Tax=Sphagnurus paluster TaxID=117069 RepID=A0A9P7KHA8_9AGAR|nr:hypothetical protein H0H81_003292 [Sphagnurus paluster]